MALAAIAASAGLLIEDLGRPSRFANMLRVFRPSSPMNMGSWLLSVYGPLVGAAALSDLLGVAKPAGRAAEFGAAVLAPAVATYTAVLVSDTAVPLWHDARRELPFVFMGSACAKREPQPCCVRLAPTCRWLAGSLYSAPRSRCR